MKLSKDITKKIIQETIDYIEDDELNIYEKLLDIARYNYKKGYGCIINEIQKKYIIIPKDILR